MVVGIDVVDELNHRAVLHGRLRILFTEVPIERELVAVAGDELTDVETPLASRVAAVERHLHGAGHWCHQVTAPPAASTFSAGWRRRRSSTRRGRSSIHRRRATTTSGCRRTCRCRPAAASPTTAASAGTQRTVVVLLLRQLEVQIDALGLCVVEDDLPLIELRDVVVHLVVAIDERPHVVAVAARVVREERHRVHAFRR